MRIIRGFTLVELMLVVAVMGVIAAIAMPSYQAYSRRGIASQAMQEIQKLAEQLERHKSRNFSYKNFDASYLYQVDNSSLFKSDTATLTLPLKANGSSITYTLYIRDGGDPTQTLTSDTVTGKSWVILAEANSKVNLGTGCSSCNSIQNGNYSFLMTSSGITCKTELALKATDTLKADNITSANACGEKSEKW
ncbi:prepilin-type N-terminal cleavage/methylation domain-containing protein [Acinetobacter sp. 194]|nr:prepilin-type N-terminal cleavage/methylation domain-containing protein [Acinetobacter shaoyimingii]